MYKKLIVTLMFFCLFSGDCSGFPLGAMQYSGVKNKDGVPLRKLIREFGTYDGRSKKEGGIMVVITGCVKKPGLYLLDDGALLGPSLEIAGIISAKEHDAHSFRQGIRLLYTDGKPKTIINVLKEEGKKKELKNGYVIKILAIVI